MQELLDNFKISDLLIILIPGILGYLIKYFQENINHKRDIKTFLWKEKISAAKNCIEYLNTKLQREYLLKFHFENQYTKSITEENSSFEISKSLSELDNILSDFPQKNYHHAELFYDFPDDNSYEISQNIAKQINNIQAINFDKITNENEFLEKYNLYKSFLVKLIKGHDNSISIIENQIEIMKSEISNHIK